MMSAWSTDALRTIADTDDLHISPGRGDGRPYGTPRGCGPSRSMTLMMCVRTTASTLADVRPRCGKRRGGSLPLG